MAKFKVLIEGYAKKADGGWSASSTTTLVQDQDLNIIVDPGINRQLLLQKLDEESINPEDIDFVLMTHTHPDHNYLSGIFSNAKALDNELVYDQDREYEHGRTVPGTDLQIISTPGHDPFHCSLVVSTEKGTVVVAGDVFWWKDGEEQKTDHRSLLEHKDPYVKDEKALLESREKILEVANWVIPGHGKMFKVG